MRGSPKHMVSKAFDALSAVGTSRHEAKSAARASGATMPQQISRVTGVHSHTTRAVYQKVSLQFAMWLKSQHGVRLTDATGEHARRFLVVKMEHKVSHRTIKTYAAALSKLGVGVEKMAADGRSRDWGKEIEQAREASRVFTRTESPVRGYRDPVNLIGAITRPEHRLAAQLQYHSGCRVSEISHLTSGRNLTVDGRLKLTNTKGGRVRVVTVPATVMRDLISHIDKYGEFWIDRAAYRWDIKDACDQTGEQYSRNGTHALRWNYAQERVQQLLDEGKRPDEVLSIVAGELGHTRPSITEWYLKR